MVNQSHIKENQSPKETCKKIQVGCASDICPSSLSPVYWLVMGGKGSQYPFISYPLIIWCPWFLLLLNSPFFCYCCTSSYLFPLPNKLILLIYLPCRESWLFPFLFPFQLISPHLLTGLPPLPVLCFLPSFPSFSSFYHFFFLYRILIFPSVIPFWLSGGWIWIGVTLFWDI